MKTDPLELVGRYLQGTASAEEFSALQELLRTDPVFRRQFARYANIDAALGSGKVAVNPKLAAVSPPRSPGVRGWWRTITAVAAGVVLGLFTASAVLGYASSGLSGMARRELVLMAEGFESAPQPGIRGVPNQPGQWGGDRARIVETVGGIAPREGKWMLQLQRSDFEGEESPVSASSDQVRVLDLQAHAGAIASGQTVLEASAWFRVLPRAEEQITAGVRIHAFASDPSLHHGAQWDLWLTEEQIAAGARQQKIHSDADWTPIRASLALPANTRFVTVHVRVTRKEPKPSAVPVEFAGAYVDEVQALLRCKHPVP